MVLDCFEGCSADLVGVSVGFLYASFDEAKMLVLDTRDASIKDHIEVLITQMVGRSNQRGDWGNSGFFRFSL